mgnify:CR=1 FL=1
MDQRPLDVPAIHTTPVSNRLRKYKRHDLLMSHLKRMSHRNDATAAKATRAAMWQVSYREELNTESDTAVRASCGWCLCLWLWLVFVLVSG